MKRDADSQVRLWTVLSVVAESVNEAAAALRALPSTNPVPSREQRAPALRVA